jgi:CheY-like chemotaxis protein
VQVCDDGMGIAPELLPSLFDPFVRGPRGADRAEGGLGIGLALVKNLVSMHGGTVHGESQGRGRGSTFTLRFPLSPELEPAAGAMPSSFPGSAAKARRILVVDDNQDAGELLAEGFRYAGHDVRIAHTAESALELIASQAPDLAILDIGLPDMDGYELASRIRSLPVGANMRLIALTGYGRDHDRQRSQAAGFSHHLVKPVDFNALLELVADP